MKCDVCGSNKAIGVAAIPFIPMSAAFCEPCLKAEAYPWRILLANSWAMGGLDNACEEWKEMVKSTCKHLNKTMDEFVVDLKTMSQELDAGLNGHPSNASTTF